MTTWVNDGFVGEMFKLTGSFMPAPPPGVEPPPLWGVEAHVEEVFSAAGPEFDSSWAHEARFRGGSLAFTGFSRG